MEELVRSLHEIPPRQRLLEIEKKLKRVRSLKTLRSRVCEYLKCGGSEIKEFHYKINGHDWKGIIYLKRNNLMGSIFSKFDNKTIIIRGFPKIKYAHDSRVKDKECIAEEKIDGTNIGIWAFPDGTIMGKSVSKNRYFLFKRMKKIKLLTLEELWNSIIKEIKHHPDKYSYCIKKEHGFEILPLKGTYTLSYDGEKIVWGKVRQIIRHFHKGTLFQIQQGLGETEVTKDHSVYSEKGIVTPLEIKEKNLFLKQITKNLKLPERKTELPIEIMDLIGAFISEGNLKGRLRIYNKDLKWLKQLQKFGQKCFPSNSWKIYYIKSWNGYELVAPFGNGKVFHFFKQFTGGHYRRLGEKQLPNWFFNLPKEYKLRFLKSYRKGDGSKRGIWSSGSTSLKLTCQLCLLIVSLLKCKPSFTFRDEQGNQSKFYRLRGVKKHIHLRKNRVVEIPYNDYVYDLSVEKWENFIDLCGLIVLHNTRMVQRWDLGSKRAGTAGSWKAKFEEAPGYEKIYALARDGYLVFCELYGYHNPGEFVKYSVPMAFKVIGIVNRERYTFLPREAVEYLCKEYDLPLPTVYYKGVLTRKDVEKIEVNLAKEMTLDGMEGLVAKYWDPNDKDSYFCKLKCEKVREACYKLSRSLIPASIIRKCIKKAMDENLGEKQMKVLLPFVLEELKEEFDESLIEPSIGKIKGLLRYATTPSNEALKEKVIEAMKEVHALGVDVEDPKNKGKVLSSLHNRLGDIGGNTLYKLYLEVLLEMKNKW